MQQWELCSVLHVQQGLFRQTTKVVAKNVSLAQFLVEWEVVASCAKLGNMQVLEVFRARSVRQVPCLTRT